MFKALGDPVRLRLLSMIASQDGGEVCVCELTPAFELSQPTISHHLKLLRQAGLIDCERRGTWVYYWVLPAALERLAAVPAHSRRPPGRPRERLARHAVPPPRRSARRAGRGGRRVRHPGHELSRDVGVQLLANSLATVFGLGVLITLLGPVSGAHFNPVVSLAA